MVNVVVVPEDAPRPLKRVVGRPLKPDKADARSASKRCKLERDREQKRRQRLQYVEEVEALKQMIDSMTARMDITRKPEGQPLPWEDIARALRDDIDFTLQSNTVLRTELRRFQTLASYARRLLALHQPIQWSPALKSSSWRDAYLFDGDELRQSGFEWITNMMFTTVPQDLMQMQDLNDLGVYSTIAYDGNLVRMNIMHEVVVRANFKQVTHMARRHPHEVNGFRLKKDNVTTILESTSNGIHLLRNTGIPGYTMNCVTRQYVQTDCSLVVTRSIVEDEKFPYLPTEFRSDIREWTLVTRRGPHTCLLRQYMTFTQPFLGDDQVVPLAEFAPLFLKSSDPSEFQGMDDDKVLRLVREALVQRHIHSQRMFESFFESLRISTPADDDEIFEC
ncbi:Aste57867_3372 [Aphanomyces stellatus]|uniref:Aste57867_3372 protein n=1 Tax=Aphanomyces stellatus TaxID=120398 RepID=A0A485KAB1_9STRA|nr:hypothetical protein As57867_003362 [Aphanomyces stellatus]VFT80538.1 Aste57867_3372 [Aphanomyces stellatus]